MVDEIEDILGQELTLVIRPLPELLSDQDLKAHGTPLYDFSNVE